MQQTADCTTGRRAPTNSRSQIQGPLPVIFLTPLVRPPNTLTLNHPRPRHRPSPAGPLPTLPSSLLVLNVSGNQLDSLPPSLPASLEIMDASFNALTGPIPPLPFNLSVIALEANQLTGPLPALQPEQAGSSRRRLTRKLLQGVSDVFQQKRM